MAALDAGCATAGCARTRRPHWYTYALVKGRASQENAFTPLSVSLCFLSVPSLASPSLSQLHFFLKSFLFNSTQSIMVSLSA